MWRDLRRGGSLHVQMRGARKQRRKRYGRYDSRGRLAGKRHLSERPVEVESRQQQGHWEIDTVMGTTSECVVTLVERKTGYLLVGKMRARTTAELNRATFALMCRHPGQFRTITADNGTEFHDYRALEEVTGVPFYFATPHHSCDAHDQMQRYVRWWREGYLSSTGICFDIGNTVAGALRRFLNEEEQTGHANPFAGSTEPDTAGNGSLMRLAPVPLFFAAEGPEKAIEMAGESSRTTHGAAAAVDGCRYMAALILGALAGASKEELLSPFFTPAGCENIWQTHPLTDSVATVASGSFRTKGTAQIRGSGYVVDSLEAALWAFDQSTSFEEGALLAVNLGDDADTTGAVYGQLTGAFYGESGIPHLWLEKLYLQEFIAGVAEHLVRLPGG